MVEVEGVEFHGAGAARLFERAGMRQQFRRRPFAVRLALIPFEAEGAERGAAERDGQPRGTGGLGVKRRQVARRRRQDVSRGLP